MNPARILSPALLVAVIAAPALASSSGEIATLSTGAYRCELPGDATGPAGLRATEMDFTVTNASGYSTAEGAGSYLLLGDRVTMTSGPLKGQRFRRVSLNFLRALASDGQDAPLRCIREGANR